MDKNSLRLFFLEKRKSLEDSSFLNERIFFFLKKFIESKKDIDSIAFYHGMSNKYEIDLSCVMEEYLDKKLILYPKILNNKMDFYPIRDKMDFKKGAYGILEPVSTIPHVNIDLIIVPGLAFNKKKHRIGYGKGYYDQYLTSNLYKYSVGCFYSSCESDFIEDKWDVMLQCIITDKGIF